MVDDCLCVSQPGHPVLLYEPLSYSGLCVHMSKVQAFCERKGVVPIVVAVLVVPARIVNEPEFVQHHARTFSYEDCKKIFVAPASRSW